MKKNCSLEEKLAAIRLVENGYLLIGIKELRGLNLKEKGKEDFHTKKNVKLFVNIKKMN